MTQVRQVRPTPRAASQISALTNENKDAFEQWVREVRRQGCAAMEYALTGEDLAGLCCSHLRGRWRVIAAFPEATLVVVVAVGEHRDGKPDDVYDSLYAAMGIEEPPGRRDKPSCCEPDGSDPAVSGELVDAVSRRVRGAARRGRRRS
ncbi:hypothetical protein SAMN06264364_10421 [Quadrisphaera granulorum]|uniref:Uncharacterized protein n=1 Tax=Quadrisphaera granulorum TaxID=317664 RepID=A0A316ADQ5_9ACTN|nr:hypothetical protein [Quadrisphaera granulorum]PWJ55100.1 hypothetical protein BXY45_10421 [Quadrisphaera granulorum]SZE95609.1 hypothetical protein SAMN06264364_10421 [Quadrisphaera granulorum]